MIEHAAQSSGVDDDVRARVLAAAIALIDKGGLATLSMREVARAAGVSHQAPYHYFSDREAILAAVAEHGFEVLGKRLERAVVSTDNGIDRFYEAGVAYVRFACESPGLFRVMFRCDFVDPDRFPQLRSCGARAFDTLPSIIQALVEQGVAALPSDQALIVLCWSVVHGLACLLLDGPLAFKVPDADAGDVARDATIRETLLAMRQLLEAAARPELPGRPNVPAVNATPTPKPRKTDAPKASAPKDSEPKKAVPKAPAPKTRAPKTSVPKASRKTPRASAKARAVD